MAIDFVGGQFANLAAQSLTRLSQAAAAPNFEILFNKAQNTALDRFDKKIEEFQDSNFGRARTALDRAKAVRLESGLEAAETFKAYASTNRQTIIDLTVLVAELKTLADPATQAEFDAKRTETLDAIDKILTSNITGLGAPDGLRAFKAQLETDVASLSAADAASATAAQTSIDAITVELNTKLEILTLNQDAATVLKNSRERTLSEVRFAIDAVEIDERGREIEKIQKLQEELSQVFGTLSLAFEASRGFSQFVADSTVLSNREIEPGSILNLFA